MMLIQAVVDAAQEARDHIDSLFVAWRSDEDPTVESSEEGHVDVIYTWNAGIDEASVRPVR